MICVEANKYYIMHELATHHLVEVVERAEERQDHVQSHALLIGFLRYRPEVGYRPAKIIRRINNYT